MTQRTLHHRSGISLMEVLISIGVIALGIFGVSTLIPAAQFRVAQGTAKARQAALGQRAIAEFRIRDMGSPGDVKKGAAGAKWLSKAGLKVVYSPPSQGGELLRRGFCIDPLGMAGTGDEYQNFPLNAESSFVMPRITMRNIYDPNINASAPDFLIDLARDVCFLKDDLVFDRPDQQQLQPNQQFLVEQVGGGFYPVKAFAQGSMSWFATLSPPISATASDEFILSIVVVQDRVVKRPPLINTQDLLTEENYARAVSLYPGEVSLLSATTSAMQVSIADLAVGDWLLLVRSANPSEFDNSTSLDKVYRWTQIVGANEAVDGKRSFAIANDDFFKPNVLGRAIFMRGVKAVYEKTIRIENSTAWN